MTTEEKFNAAVNVIRSLPKDGVYQPSKELQLKFYTYFKQATEGPCDKPKPAFWDVVGRIKWDAWKRLGNMSKKQAMEHYINELKSIVETMSYNDNIGRFLGSLGSFYDSVPVEDIEMLLGPVLERVRSQPGSPLEGSPLGSRETSPTRVPRNLVNKVNTSSFETSPTSSVSISPHPPDTDDEDEEFIDTVETTPHASRKFSKSNSNSPVVVKRKINAVESSNLKEKNGSTIINNHSSPKNGGLPNGNAVQMSGSKYSDSDEEENETRVKSRDKESPNIRKKVIKQNGGPRSNGYAFTTDLSEPLKEAFLHLQKDLERITARVSTLEANSLSKSQCFYLVDACTSQGKKFEDKKADTEENAHVPVKVDKTNKKLARWWPFPDISVKTAFFILAWPFIVHFVLLHLQQKRRRN